MLIPRTRIRLGSSVVKPMTTAVVTILSTMLAICPLGKLVVMAVITAVAKPATTFTRLSGIRSEEHTSELQSRPHLVCRLLLEKKKQRDSRLLFRNTADGDELIAVLHDRADYAPCLATLGAERDVLPCSRVLDRLHLLGASRAR